MSTSTSTGVSPGGIPPAAAVDGISPGGSSASGGVGQVSPDPQQQSAASSSTSAAVDPSWSRRGLERLSGLKEFGFEVLSRRQRHERDKSGGTSSSRSQQQEPRSPEVHKASPPYSRSTTADGDPRSLESSSTATASTPASTAAAVNPAPDLPARPPQASHSSNNSYSTSNNMNYSSSNRSPGPLSAGSTSSMRKPTFVLVTQDHESLAKVDIANLGSPAAIRERLYTKAHIPDDDFQHCTLHLSSLDQVDPGTSLDDGEIWQICQGVVSGELVPAPLFYVRMSVDQNNGSGGRPSSNNGGSASASPEYQYTPSSPFVPHGQSPFGDHAAAPVAGPSNPRPDSRHDTSSNSSVSASRRPPSRSHYSRSNTQDNSLASPLRAEQQQQQQERQHQQLPSSSSSHRPHSANHSPQPPHSTFFEPDRRASAEQALVRDRAQHHTSRSHDYVEPQQQQQYHQAWERRSSAGTSEYSDRPEWLERPSQLRRQDRQSHSETTHPRPQWDPRDMPPPSSSSSSRPPVTVQQVGIGPSGPIYRSVPPSASSSRPRANSASNGDHNHEQPYPSHHNRPTSSGRNQPPAFNGPAYFPQPQHHHETVGSSSTRRQQNLSDIPPHLQPGPSRIDHNLNSVRSMGDLRGGPPPNYNRTGPSPTGGMGPSSAGSGMPQASRSPYAPPPTLYEDPRYASQPMRGGASDMGRPSSQIVSPRNTFQHSLSPPPSHPQARMPPTNTSPRIPSYPPAVQRLPPPLHPSQMQRPGSAQQRGYPAPPVAHRRPSYEQMQRPMVVPPQLLAGPQRIPLQPGETVQESLQGQQYSHRQARHSGGSSHTSPRHSQTTFEPLPPNHPHHQHQQQQQQQHHQHQQPQPHHHHSQQLPPSYAGRAHSYEERSRPFSAQEAHFRNQQTPNINNSRPQFVQQDSFTSSPPLQAGENNLYEQQAFDYATPRHNTDNGRRAPGVSHSSPQFFEVHRSADNFGGEHPQSPASSRLSTSSDAHSLDKSAHRPESYSSNSTNEVPTPMSDRVEKPRRLPYEPHEIKPPQLTPIDIVPHVVDQDDVYEGVEILRESIDAATIDDEEKGQSQYDSRPTTADASTRIEAGDEATSTIQASEWANLISRMNEKPDGSDGDTLGKSTKRQSIEKSDEESSTLGKTKPSPLGLDKKPEETADQKKPKAEEGKATTGGFVMPTPAITYNPDDDDDDDEVMTWAVQMKPSKKPEETPKPTDEAVSLQTEKASGSSASATHGSRTEPPKHIALPSHALDESASASPRVERPSLKLQTDMLGPNGTPPPRHSPLPHTSSNSHSSKTHKSGNASVSALANPAKPPSSASPRSAARRHRQSSKDSLSAEDAHATSSTSTHHSHHSQSQRKPPEASHIEVPSHDADRRPSFDNNDWAFRPPVEQVYENLEDFFPGHDLDKPIVDVGASGSNSAVSSPAQESAPFTSPTRVKSVMDEERSSPSTVPQSHAQTSTSAETEPLLTRKEKDSSAREVDSVRRFNNNRKSMRMVAHDRKIRMKREETLNKATAVASSSKDANALKLARRKSTKVWGRKIEEVTAAEADLLHSARTDTSERDELAPIKWVKGELIGKGTYGHVYIGFNVTNGEMIAVKQVELPRTASDKEDNRQLSVIEALKSEMELLKDLEHEKIVSYLGFEETPAHLSILLEYVPGGSVGRCLRKYGKFDVQVIQFFTTQILEGLEYLHARGILHRDLKADNILVKMDGTIKISDFGISKRSNDIYNNNSNMSMQGSIFWMAPEVVHNQRKGYSAKIDIWSLGCVVLEMFAGRRPWDSEEAIQAMFKLGAERLAPPVPKDVVLTNQSSHFLKECFHGEADRRPTASRLLCHKFLTLDKNWDFRTCSLAKAMST